MKKIKKLEFSRSLQGYTQSYLILGGIIVAMFLFFTVFSRSFFSIDTVGNVARQASGLGFAVIGMMMILLVSGIDLSIGSNMALAAALAAVAMQRLGDSASSAIVGFLITFAASTAIGALNGFFIGVLDVSPFMTTLATMSLCRGLTLTITKAERIVVSNPYYNALGAGELLGQAWLPIVLIALLMAFFIGWFLLSRTTYGRRLYALGGNKEAARASGINVGRQIILVYAVAGVFAAAAAIATVGRAASVHPYMGQDLAFEAITAAVLGGVSLSGGRGTMTGSFLGWVLVGVMTTGFGNLSVSPLIIYIVKGILILAAILINC